MKEFPELFSGRLGRTKAGVHKIRVGDTAPIKLSPYRTSPVEDKIIEENVQQMLKDGVVEKSESPWSAPVVLVKKKDGKWRFCIDYRRLNAITKRDVYPLPRIDDTIDKLAQATIFTTLDLKSGYWQIEMAQEDKEKTAFTTKTGLYQFRVMPFGLTNAPPTFQRTMEKILRDVRFRNAMVYLDDIIIYSRNIDDHFVHLRDVFKRIQEAGLTLNPIKCEFVRNQVKYLGHIISKFGIEVDPEKIETIKKFPTPTCQTSFKSFLGLAGYYRKYIKDFAKIAEPLHKLLYKGVKFVWSKECELAFKQLKDFLLKSPILRLPDFNKDFIIYTDASDIGLGAILSQIQDDKEVVIAYASRALRSPERNYSTTEKECLAVVWSFKYFRTYIFGQTTIVITDHVALKWLMKKKEPAGRLARWALEIQEHEIEFQHRPGKMHQNVDALSRIDPTLIASVSEKSTYLLKKIAKMQKKDTELQPWIEWHKKNGNVQ